MAVETGTMEVTVPQTFTDAPVPAALSQDEDNTKKETNKKDASKWLHKTRLCVYLVQGSCRLGSKCSFAHSVTEVQEAPNLHKTQMCTAFEEGNCTNENCSFAHGQEELRLSPNFKNKICKWFGQGKCRNGTECGFAHGNEELRSQQAAQQQAQQKAAIAPPPGLSLEEDKQEKIVLSLAAGLIDQGTRPSLEKQVEGMSATISALQWKMDDMSLRSQVTGMKQFLGELSEQCALLESALAPLPPPAVHTPLKTKLKSNAQPFQPLVLSSQAQPFVPSYGTYQSFGGYDSCVDACNPWNSDESTDIGSGAETGGFSSD